METSEAEKELVLRAQKGDRAALTELMSRAAPTVAALVHALAPGLRQYEDVTQEVLVRAITHLRTVRDPGRFRAYLNEITRNLVFDLKRRDRHMVPLAEEPVTRGENPIDQVVHHEEQERVRAAILSLHELDRQVILLRHWADASYETIADTLGLTVSAVQSRLFRARRELAGRLGDERRGNPAGA
jgi:RNA polymerase sigma-70 factor, ECF subfamily